MSDMEARLDQVLATVQGTVANVVALVGQVLEKMQGAEAGIDLTDETAALEGLQTDLQGAVDRMQSALDTVIADTTPTGDETTGGTSTVEGEVTTGTEPV